MHEPYKFLSLASETPLVFREAFTPDYARPENYRPAKGLGEAIDSAILLGMPLLLTGEPGTGKTQAARWLAWRFNTRLLRHDVKSTTGGRDLLYTFDDVARFRDASAGHSRPLIDYITFSALGEAIIRTLGGGAPIVPIMPGGTIHATSFGDLANPTMAALLPRDPAFAASEPEHCVVLIDELDKAPRDTPNDLLAEVESLAFDIPELGIRINAQTRWRPVVLITSNSERALPEPFLRRCLFFHIPLPDETEMGRIVEQSIAQVTGTTTLFASAWTLYNTLRDQPTILKKPSTAEFLGWIDCLRDQGGLGSDDSVMAHRGSPKVKATLCCIAKSTEDLTLAQKLLEAAQ